MTDDEDRQPDAMVIAVGQAAADVGDDLHPPEGSVHLDLAKLRASIDALAEAIGGLASKDEVENRLAEERREASSRRRKLIAAFSTAAVAVAVALVALLGVAHQNSENGKILVTCTTPGTADHPHACYDRGVRSQVEAIAAIVDANRNGVLDVDEIKNAVATHTSPALP